MNVAPVPDPTGALPAIGNYSLLFWSVMDFIVLLGIIILVTLYVNNVKKRLKHSD